jgi:plasmid stability protein
MQSVETVTVPQSLYQQIRERASASGRTVDEQAAEVLAKALADEAQEAAVMAEIRAERDKLNVPFLTEAELQRMKRSGRE